MRNIIVKFCVVLFVVLLSGCGTTTLQTRAKLSKSVVIDHSQIKNKNLYLQVTNTAGSGGENMHLYDNLEKKLTSKGYTIVKSSSDASYGLFINVLWANNLKEANAVKAGVSAGILGASTAAISGSSGSDSLIVGAIAALGGAAISKALEDEVFRAVVDVRIREYTPNKISTYRSESDNGGAVINKPRSGNLNRLAGPIGSSDGAGGDLVSGISEETTTVRKKDYEEYRTRAFVEATKMDLDKKEALPILEEKSSIQIANLF